MNSRCALSIGTLIATIAILNLPLSGYANSKDKTNEDEFNEANSTALSICKKSISANGRTGKLAISIATQTPSEKICPTIGAAKATALEKSGFECTDKKGKNKFECNKYGNVSYAVDLDKGIAYDRLDFTDRDGNSTVITYYNNGGEAFCKKDKAALETSGIKDAKCHPRKVIK